MSQPPKVKPIKGLETQLAIIYRPINGLEPYKNNARTHTPDQVHQIARSIQKFGFTNPILIDGKNGIIAGHGRILAAKELGYSEVPIIELAGLTDAQKRAYIIADNKLALNAGWDNDILRLELAEIRELGEDLSITGFSDDEIARLMGDKQGLTDPDDIPEVVEPISKAGDLWSLDNHRLICGDSTDAATVAELLGPVRPHLMVTDPPYGVGRDKGFEGFGGFGPKIARRRYENDDWDSSRPDAAALAAILALAPNAIIWGGNFFADLLPQSSHWIVWDKLNTMPTFGDCELAWTNSHRKSVSKITVEYNGLIGKERERFHPTQKPIKLFIEILNRYSNRGETIADPYLGSGTTIIAAEMTGRHCYAIEINPAYVDIAVKRWENFTGKKAVLLNGSTQGSEGLEVRQAMA